MLFSIGQVSKMFNMSHDTLRYYDKIGLVKPSIRKENGYRYYSMKELELLDEEVQKKWANLLNWK